MAASFNIVYEEKLAGKIYSIKGFCSLFASFIVSYLQFILFSLGWTM
jgi:hypothetical protein